MQPVVFPEADFGFVLVFWRRFFGCGSGFVQDLDRGRLSAMESSIAYAVYSARDHRGLIFHGESYYCSWSIALWPGTFTTGS